MLDSITGLGIVIDGIMLHDEFEVSEDAGENSQFRFGGDPVSLGAVGTTLETNFDDLITSLQLQNSSQTVSYILGVPGQEGRLWDNGGTDPPNYFSHRLHYFWISGTGDPRVPSYGDDSRAIAYENTLGTVRLKVQD